MNIPVLTSSWVQPAALPLAPPAVPGSIIPGATLSQLIAIDGYVTNLAVPLIGDIDVGGLRVVNYAWDVTKGGANIQMVVEPGGELKTTAYGFAGAVVTPVMVEATGEVVVSLRALDSVSGLPVAPVVVGDALKVVTAGAAAATGASINGTAAASGVIKPANATSKQVVIQNVDAAETLYVSFNNPATTDDIQLTPLMSITYNSGVANDIYGLGSGAGAKYSIQEMS